MNTLFDSSKQYYTPGVARCQDYCMNMCAMSQLSCGESCQNGCGEACVNSCDYGCTTACITTCTKTCASNIIINI